MNGGSSWMVVCWQTHHHAYILCMLLQLRSALVCSVYAEMLGKVNIEHDSKV
jgi:hypothetical protein